MAVAAESIPSQEYGRSVSALWKIGQTAVEAAVTPEFVHTTLEVGRADFVTAVTEMLKTDPEFRELLDVDNSHEHPVIDGQVCDDNGVPMVTIVGQGAEKSKEIASYKPEFQLQADRDSCDLDIARRADQLKPGETLMGLSMDPKQALKQYEEAYTKLGYIEGLAYWQFYSRVDEDNLVAGSYSIDMSDENVWRELFAELEITVPEGESPDNWLRHAFTITATAEEAQALVLGIRDKFYKKIGSQHTRSSVTEFVNACQPQIDQIFDNYYLALGAAVYTGKNNETLKTFAQAMLGTGMNRLDHDVRQQLIRVANTNTFDGESCKLIDSVLRYAAVEELRKKLVKAKDKMSMKGQPQSDLMDYVNSESYAVHPGQLNQLLASNVEAGTQAGRSYGGCPGQIKLNGDSGLESFTSLERITSPQEAYGGKKDQNDQEQVSNNGKIRCIQCREYVDKAEVVKKDCWECPRCKHKVDICSGQVTNQGKIEEPEDKTNVYELFTHKTAETPGNNAKRNNLELLSA